MSGAGQQGYTCQTCGKNYTRAENLERHYRSAHSTAREYTCSQCSATFNRSDALLRHERIHAASAESSSFTAGGGGTSYSPGEWGGSTSYTPGQWSSASPPASPSSSTWLSSSPPDSELPGPPRRRRGAPGVPSGLYTYSPLPAWPTSSSPSSSSAASTSPPYASSSTLYTTAPWGSSTPTASARPSSRDWDTRLPGIYTAPETWRRDSLTAETAGPGTSPGQDAPMPSSPWLYAAPATSSRRSGWPAGWSGSQDEESRQRARDEPGQGSGTHWNGMFWVPRGH